jgi:hypothetical protein
MLHAYTRTNMFMTEISLSQAFNMVFNHLFIQGQVTYIHSVQRKKFFCFNFPSSLLETDNANYSRERILSQCFFDGGRDKIWTAMRFAGMRISTRVSSRAWDSNSWQSECHISVRIFSIIPIQVSYSNSVNVKFYA